MGSSNIDRILSFKGLTGKVDLIFIWGLMLMLASASSLEVECDVAIVVTRVRFPAGAFLQALLSFRFT